MSNLRPVMKRLLKEMTEAAKELDWDLSLISDDDANAFDDEAEVIGFILSKPEGRFDPELAGEQQDTAIETLEQLDHEIH